MKEVREYEPRASDTRAKSRFDVSRLLPQPNLDECDLVKTAEGWKREANKDLELIEANAELTAFLYEYALKLYADAEADRDRMANRADRALAFAGVVIGFSFTSFKLTAADEWIRFGIMSGIGTLLLFVAAAALLTIKFAFEVGALPRIGSVVDIARKNVRPLSDPHLHLVARVQYLTCLNIHKAEEKTRSTIEWCSWYLGWGTFLILIGTLLIIFDAWIAILCRS